MWRADCIESLLSLARGLTSGQRFLLPDSSLQVAVLQVARDLPQVASLVSSLVGASRPPGSPQVVESRPGLFAVRCSLI